ncbi:MAG: hypothetical protein Q8M01_00290 [Rubrivivax sp.]|nr:hypothetical protein [Rubrivivax sp.]
MLRAVVVVLLLANLLFFGWARGWFAPGWPPPRHGEREPERLAAQLRPELITVLPPQAASAAVSAAREAARAATEVCLEAGPFDAAGITAAEAALAGAGLPAGSWERLDAKLPSSQPWLRLPRADADVQARVQALAAAFRPCEAR